MYEDSQHKRPAEDPLPGAAIWSGVGPRFDEAELRRALAIAYLPDDAREIGDLLCRNGVDPEMIWVGDIVFYVAMLSPEHEARIQQWLGVTRQVLLRELERVREELLTHPPETRSPQEQ
jgi:hypothetical protein